MILKSIVDEGSEGLAQRILVKSGIDVTVFDRFNRYILKTNINTITEN